MILFHHKSKTPKPRFAAWFFIALIAAFCIVTSYQITIGLTGLGVTLLIAGVLLELNSPRIWAESLQWRKKNKNRPWYTRPNELLYKIHIWILWPLVILLGIGALKAAYFLAN